MEYSDIDINNLAELLQDEDFSKLFRNDVHLSTGINVESDSSDPCSSLLELLNEAPTDYEISITTAELNDLLPDGLMHNNAIMEEQADVQNTEPETVPVVQQAIENGLMYQMTTALFNFITNLMSVKQQPKANNRFRYECDGRRFLPDSRYHPMSLELPDLRSIRLVNNQQLGIVITIVTNSNNPMNGTFVHANDIMCSENGVQKIAYGCIFVPLEHSDIDACEKKFKRLSILYKKYDEYTFDLTPFDAYTMFGATETYIIPNGSQKEKVPKGKLFKKEYNLLSYKFVFQLALKQDNVVFISNITCETNTIDEQPTGTKTPGKRSASVPDENLAEDDDTYDSQVSNASKKFKSSTSSLNSLPVTRVSNGDIPHDMDLQSC